jgi:UDP-N-acetylmuramate--alanine ligase
MMENKILNEVKRVHLIGIGGIGMSGIAEYLARKGYEVSGSDITMTQITERLKNFGVTVSYGHDEKNINENTELVIYTSAVNEDNVEYQKAKNLSIKKPGLYLLKRAEMLGAIVNDKYLISVSGTHGKTTTTAMAAKVLIDNDLDPTVFAGGNINFLDGGSSRIGKSNIAIVEADEYDRSFHHLRSDIAVILNIEADHLDIYKDVDDVKDSFKKFIDNSKKDGAIICNGDDKNAIEVTSGYENKILFGIHESNEYRISNIDFSQKGMSFDINGLIVDLKVPGEHNAIDAGAVYLISKKLNIPDEGFKKSIVNFTGVKRRLELKYDGELKVYDDYAHHPTEVRKTLETLNRIKGGKIITVFQPHLYSRTRDFHREFADAFDLADVLILEKIYPAREDEIKGVSSRLILNEYLGKNKEGSYIEDQSEVYKKLDEVTRINDIVIFMGAGTVTDHCDEFIETLKAKTK